MLIERPPGGAERSSPRAGEEAKETAGDPGRAGRKAVSSGPGARPHGCSASCPQQEPAMRVSMTPEAQSGLHEPPGEGAPPGWRLVPGPAAFKGGQGLS